MKAGSLALALWTVSAALQAESQSSSPDWFDAFRGKAYLQGDASFVAREKSAAPDSPPVFRARWIVLRFGGFAEKDRQFWPYRNLVLVTIPGGSRYVLESSFGFVDETHRDEERPWQRIASGKGAFEVWSSGTAGDPPPDPAGEGAGPCEGMRQRVLAAGGSLTFFVDDLRSRTVRMTLAEITTATFDEEEKRDLAALLKASLQGAPSLSSEPPFFRLSDPLLAVSVALRDQVLPPEQRTLTFFPDPAPPGDLASWRGLAHLPLDLPPFPALPPEIQ